MASAQVCGYQFDGEYAKLQLPYPIATLDFLHPRMPVLGLRLLPFGRKVLVDEVGWHVMGIVMGITGRV